MPDVAGQDIDVRHCAARIAAIGKRVLLVHGKEAADREAFVQDRLAPFLEADDRMYGFVRVPDGMIIRQPQQPARTIADALLTVADGTGQVGPRRRMCLSTGMSAGMLPASRRSSAGSGMAEPFRVLADLTDIWPDTVVVVVSDPAIPDLADPADPFLSFLCAVGDSQIDAKVVVALDHEPYVRLRHALRAGTPEGAYVVEHRVQ